MWYNVATFQAALRGSPSPSARIAASSDNAHHVPWDHASRGTLAFALDNTFLTGEADGNSSGWRERGVRSHPEATHHRRSALRSWAMPHTRGTVTPMALDLILRHARLASAGPEQPTVDIGVHNGLIVAVEPQLTAEDPAYDVGGKLVSPGLIESHFHLDKARLINRVPFQPNRMVRDHMERTAAIKQTFTPDEMYARAHATLEQCLLHGVTHMRTQIEVDPNVGLLGFEVIEQLRRDYAWAIDLQPCVFLQCRSG